MRRFAIWCLELLLKLIDKEDHLSDRSFTFTFPEDICGLLEGYAAKSEITIEDLLLLQLEMGLSVSQSMGASSELYITNPADYEEELLVIETPYELKQADSIYEEHEQTTPPKKNSKPLVLIKGDKQD